MFKVEPIGTNCYKGRFPLTVDWMVSISKQVMFADGEEVEKQGEKGATALPPLFF